ncbi:iron-containing alcohol dehydrogenase, partial [Candidatus Aerophobetes bacterium]|nr:iron-containing alcohol dehydrogenase [Candidatus Aerophobetes bacterium]
MQSFTYYMPVEIFFGQGELEKLGSLTENLGKKALLVTGKKSMKKLGITDKVMKLLESSSVEAILYDNIP